MAYNEELEALQRWVKATADLNSIKLKESMPALTRPVIVWETPSRGRNQNLSRYKYTVKVIQFGKLYVKDVGQGNDLQDALISDLEERVGVLPIYRRQDGVDVQVAILKQATIEFDPAETLEIPFKITYEATYTRTKPEPYPQATYVGLRIVIS